MTKEFWKIFDKIPLSKNYIHLDDYLIFAGLESALIKIHILSLKYEIIIFPGINQNTTSIFLDE